jgi:CheY-like chemotaxis protein
MPLEIVNYRQPLKILYVDDDPEDKEFFSEALEKLAFDHELHLAADYDELISLLKSEKTFDIIFLDLNLPGNDGIQCLKELKESSVYCNIPIIIFSTNQNESIINKVYDMGAHYHVVKPYAQINFVASLAIIFSIDWRKTQQPPLKHSFVIDNTYTVERNLQSGV